MSGFHYRFIRTTGHLQVPAVEGAYILEEAGSCFLDGGNYSWPPDASPSEVVRSSGSHRGPLNAKTATVW